MKGQAVPKICITPKDPEFEGEPFLKEPLPLFLLYFCESDLCSSFFVSLPIYVEPYTLIWLTKKTR